MIDEITILFVGETWSGSSARSLREAMTAQPSVRIDDIGEDLYKPKGRSKVVRAANRVLDPWYRAELATEILHRLDALKPDVLLVYKGNLVTAESVRAAKTRGIATVNVFPDFSPHAYGGRLRQAMGEYDLVISTKPFHPEQWKSTYGYRNPCICVPHGYDPAVHLWTAPPQVQDLDVVMAASWRPQYETLMVELARLIGESAISVALAGNGWVARRHLFPRHWQFPGGLYGRSYGEFVRRGKIVIAPVHTDVVINRKRQPGDEDTTRTYELAAAGAFFLHRRTPFAQTVYVEGIETSFWDNAAELASLVKHYLPLESERRRMALAAHKRAVPAYSVPTRAAAVVHEIRKHLEGALS